MFPLPQFHLFPPFDEIYFCPKLQQGLTIPAPSPGCSFPFAFLLDLDSPDEPRNTVGSTSPPQSVPSPLTTPSKKHPGLAPTQGPFMDPATKSPRSKRRLFEGEDDTVPGCQQGETDDEPAASLVKTSCSTSSTSPTKLDKKGRCHGPLHTRIQPNAVFKVPYPKQAASLNLVLALLSTTFLRRRTPCTPVISAPVAPGVLVAAEESQVVPVIPRSPREVPLRRAAIPLRKQVLLRSSFGLGFD